MARHPWTDQGLDLVLFIDLCTLFIFMPGFRVKHGIPRLRQHFTKYLRSVKCPNVREIPKKRPRPRLAI